MSINPKDLEKLAYEFLDGARHLDPVPPDVIIEVMEFYQANLDNIKTVKDEIKSITKAKEDMSKQNKELACRLTEVQKNCSHIGARPFTDGHNSTVHCFVCGAEVKE